MNIESLQSPGIQQALRALDFVEETRPGELDFWCVAPSRDNAADIARGEEYAETVLAIAREFNMPALIGLVIRDMVFAREWTGIEAGFVAAIVSAAKVGSHH